MGLRKHHTLSARPAGLGDRRAPGRLSVPNASGRRGLSSCHWGRPVRPWGQHLTCAPHAGACLAQEGWQRCKDPIPQADRCRTVEPPSGAGEQQREFRVTHPRAPWRSRRGRPRLPSGSPLVWEAEVAPGGRGQPADGGDAPSSGPSWVGLALWPAGPRGRGGERASESSSLSRLPRLCFPGGSANGEREAAG